MCVCGNEILGICLCREGNARAVVDAQASRGAAIDDALARVARDGGSAQRVSSGVGGRVPIERADLLSPSRDWSV